MANAIVVTVTPSKGKKPNESKASSPVQSSEVEVSGVVGEAEVPVSTPAVSPEGLEVHPEFGVLLPNGRAYLKHNN